jgi:hypothetical protein
MPRKFLDRVTVTGADDSTNISTMVSLSESHPFVEWGILLSKSSEGNSRFPSMPWMKELAKALAENPTMKLSGHLCGSWVRDLCKGQWTFVEDTQGLIEIFGRIQLNFHAIRHNADLPALAAALRCKPNPQYILQLDGVNDGILGRVVDAGVDAVPLFDLSGGAGILPGDWPESQSYQGYAGGLSAENVAAQLEIISAKSKGLAWIDAETRLRPADDSCLRMDWVEKYLEQSRPFVI